MQVNYKKDEVIYFVNKKNYVSERETRVSHPVYRQNKNI